MVFKDIVLTDCVINSKEGFFYHNPIIKIAKKNKSSDGAVFLRFL